MPLTDEQREMLALHLVPGLGPRLTAALLARFGSPAAIMQATPCQLAEVPHIGYKLAHDFVQAIQGLDVAAEAALMERHGVHLLTLGSAEYPAPLADIPDPPHLLYVRGSWEARDAKAVGLVGSRHCTAYGVRVAERLAEGLVHAGYTVISGLARGIDGAAHRGALKAGGRTIAVLAGGLSKIYPPEHAGLATEVEDAGALISEATMDQEPLAGMFPARNRLISGLARGIVVVEAAERSGALITARHAAEQGRTVFAIPGPVDSAASAGTLRLLREGAILVRKVEDIVEELEELRRRPVYGQEAPPALDDTQRRVWEFLAEQPRHVDEIARHLGMAVHGLGGILITLEMKRIIRRLPGNMYERC